MSSTEVLPHENVHGRDEVMLSQDLWTEIRLMSKMGKPIKVIARELSISKNTVKRALRQEQYQPYQRVKPKPKLLSKFMPFLLERSPQVGFNATTLFRELKEKGYGICQASCRFFPKYVWVL